MNTIRVVSPPALIEQGKSLQLAHRETLNSRFLHEKIKVETKRRRKLHQKRNPNSSKKAGGTLQVSQQKLYKIWTRRRTYLAPSYFLRPQGDYDQQGRLAVDSSTDDEKFTEPVIITPLVPTGDGRFIDQNTTFKIENNTLSCSPRLISPAIPNSVFNTDYFLVIAGLSYRSTDSQTLQPDSLDCTLEAFIELPAIEQQAAIQQVDLSQGLPYYPPTPPPYNIGYLVTSYSSFLRISGPHFSVEITKNLDTVVAPGYRLASSMVGPWRARVFRSGLQPFENIILGTPFSSVHLAIAYSNSKLSVYLAGQRLAQIDHFPTSFDPRILSVNVSAESTFGLHNLLPPSSAPGYASFSAPSFNVPFKVSRIRLTLDSIYSGNSFVPPSTINGVY